MRLREIAHSRTGDKGDISNISVIAYDPADYELLVREVTVERVGACLGGTVQGEIDRFEIPGLSALNFVLHKALGGGVTRSLALDAHGKSLSSYVLAMEIDKSA
ncbi:Uncharacterised protein [Brevundimonas diminuta]|jgi:hypothetical protein|uniref:AtuA-like ferredoxin-fold domain-containing protein n=1 Tax=Brevundimonas diminuta TaxID=293 RepID=A0A246KMR0_BREDI|nr:MULTISPECIES: hypothetical protein [Brevundimonas]MBD3832574.1 hypothetical protein [Brevundimonas sp.]EGF94787.1 beta-lactamase [Brevundimonas diminuta ATCC 11568]MBD3574536.1 hypothetical protein [Brevundimonas diminuta]MBI2249545.1 hypothetical protein [Brevundimonas diminuta]MDM8351463.1 hypothetical protein [Brevundimonas diminuta]